MDNKGVAEFINAEDAELFSKAPAPPKRRPDRYLYSVKEYKFVSEDEIEVIATTGLPNRLREVLPASSLKTENYLKNPVVLWSHDWEQLPIGKTTLLRPEGEKMIHRITFSPMPFAQQIKQLFKEGFLHAWSYGFVINSFKDDEKGDVRTITDAELLELSAVNVPADAGALSTRELALYALPNLELGDGVQFRKVIPHDKTPKADDGEEWDGGKEIAAADVEDLMVMCAWYDAEYPNIKASYKLPHHKAEAPHEVVWRAVVAAGNVIMGARGGVDIPEGDIPGVKAHLEQHYHEFERQAAWEKEASASSWAKKIERVEHLVKELRTGRKESPTDLALLHEIMCVTVDLRVNIGQEEIADIIKSLGMLLGKDDAISASIIVGKALERLSAGWLDAKTDKNVSEILRSIYAEQSDLRERLARLGR